MDGLSETARDCVQTSAVGGNADGGVRVGPRFAKFGEQQSQVQRAQQMDAPGLCGGLVKGARQLGEGGERVAIQRIERVVSPEPGPGRYTTRYRVETRKYP